MQIPFIEADKLLDVVNGILEKDKNGSQDDEPLLSNAERRRNVRGESHIFVPPRGTLTQEQREHVEASFADLDRKPQRRAKVRSGQRPPARRGRPLPRRKS